MIKVVKNSSRVALLVCSLVLLNACAGSFLVERPANNHYCDNFLIYEMCIQDTDGDGLVEYTYFGESREVFMFREGAEDMLPTDMPLHRCARAMDEELVEVSSRIFYIDEESSYIEKTDIRGALMLKYMVRLPEVAACNLRAEQAAQEAES